MSEEVALSDGWPSVGGSVLIDGEVHRSAGRWTRSVHALLRHLADAGFEGAPHVIGFDTQGREVLTWVEGEAPLAPWPSWMVGVGVLASLGSLLRQFHDAVESFEPPADSVWRSWIGSKPGPIVRHGDLWPSNVVFRNGQPAALIDWEFAQPGTRLEDLASAAKHWVPLVSDERAAMEGWILPLDRAARLRVLCDGYGLAGSERRDLIPTVIRNLECAYRSHREWALEGVAGFVEMWKAGSGEIITGDRLWLEANQDLAADQGF